MSFTNGLTQRGLTIVRPKIDWGTLGNQDLGYANVTCPSGPVQRSPAIVPPRIDRNIRRQQNLNSTDLSCLGCRMQQNLAVGPLGYQDLGYANVTRPSGPVQRSPAIVPPRIDRNIRRQQNLNSTDLSCLGCRMQQNLAVGPLGYQDLGYANVTRPSGPVQRSPAIVPPRIDRNIRRQQNLNSTDLSCLGCRMQQNLAVGPLGYQDLGYANVTRPSGPVQRSPAIVPPRIDRNIRRQQNLNDTDLSCLGCRMQQSLAVGLLGEQDLRNFDMSFASGLAQWGLTIVRTKIDLGTLGKQDLDDAGVSRPSSRVQRGPAIASPRIDRNIRRQQNLNGTDLSCLGYRMQQSLAVGLLGEQDLRNFDMSFASGLA